MDYNLLFKLETVFFRCASLGSSIVVERIDYI